MPTPNEPCRGLIDALRAAEEKNQDSYDGRFEDDPDGAERGYDFWREYKVMAEECRDAVHIVESRPPTPHESSESWFDRIDSEFRKND